MDITDRFICGESYYRVDGFYKVSSVPHIKSLMDDILYDDPSQIPTNKIKLILCEASEADFVSGVGIAGTIVLLKDVIYNGKISWEVELIEQAKKEYSERLQNENDDIDFTFSSDYRRERYNEKISAAHIKDNLFHNLFMKLTKKHAMLQNMWRYNYKKHNRRASSLNWEKFAIKMKLMRCERMMWNHRLGKIIKTKKAK
jgi:hypothetical protein